MIRKKGRRFGADFVMSTSGVTVGSCGMPGNLNGTSRVTTFLSEGKCGKKQKEKSSQAGHDVAGR